jgi:glutamine amidotransferase
MITPSVTIIDYGAGNLLSIKRAFEYLGANVTVSSDPKTILDADKVILPGVGAFPSAINALKKLNLIPVIREAASNRKSILGLCLGMQLLFDESNEFEPTLGLGLIPGKVVPIPKTDSFDYPQKIPHVGWNSLITTGNYKSWQNTLLKRNRPGDSFYFVHSHMALPSNQLHRLAEARYGGHVIVAAVAKDNIVGFQFHPEKSGIVGLKILDTFMKEVR